MKVVVINEENHGMIGIASTEKAAFQFLINRKWLTFGLEFWDEEKGQWTIRQLFEEHGWNQTSENLLSWALARGTDWIGWDGYFYFHEDEIYEED